MSVEIYTDGACSGNPGPGGWGAILVYGDIEKEINGGEDDTTNNRMEMMAVIMALSALKKSSDITLYTDSKYVQNGIEEWLPGWKAKGWKTTTKKPVKNQDLWEQIDSLISLHTLKIIWVKGHSGHEMNERVDKLAVAGISKA